MTKKVSEKEKFHNKVVRYIEHLVQNGTNVTRARSMAEVKFGVSAPTLITWTSHLNVRANKEVVSEA